MNTNQPFGKNKFCGPTVLSVLSGRSTDECALLASRDGNPLKGMYVSEMGESLRKLGIKYIWKRCYNTKYYNQFNRRHPYPTLKTWAETCRKPSERNNIFLINITGHYILLKGNMVLCSQTLGEWVPLSEYRRKSSHVQNFFKIINAQEEQSCL